MDEFDVVVVGAGPVGLFLACELGLAGCAVLVLEQEAALGSPWRVEPLGMRGLFTTSTEAFHRRGILGALLKAAGIPDDPGENSGEDELSPPRMVGHFAGMSPDPVDVDLAAWPFRLPSPAPQAMMVSLDAVESVLSQRALELGVRIRRGAAVSAVTQDDEGVVVRAGEHEYAARWLAGCDGGRSTVRKLAGFDFVGTEPQFTGYVAATTMADPEKLGSSMITLTDTGAYVRMFADGQIGMMDFDGGAYDRTQPPTREHVQAVLRRLSGTDVTVRELHRVSTFTDRAKQATTYRKGRILIAGDAAHIHSPLGGQGLNTGLGDAMNLGWKLAATVRGHAPDGLLDTYTGERHPIGARVLDWSRAQVEVMRPDPHARAVREVIRDLIATGDGATHVFRKVSGSAIRYDLAGDHPLVGYSAPDFRFADDTRLADLMCDGHGVALDFTTGECLRESAMGRADRIRYRSGPVRNDLGLGAVLIRPDGIVAWASDHTPDLRSFERAADHWFGSPATGSGRL